VPVLPALLRHLFQHHKKLVPSIAVASPVVQEVLHLGDQRPSIGRSCNDDSPPSAEFEEPFFSDLSTRSAPKTVFVFTPRTAARSFA
jgi:hypothetical protein